MQREQVDREFEALGLAVWPRDRDLTSYQFNGQGHKYIY
jgi:hypothetical protein